MNNLISKYSIYARVLPGVLTFLPIFTLFCKIIGKFPDLNPAKFFVNFHEYVGYVMLLPFVYLFSLFCREVGRKLERWFFLSKSGFPTTYLMLYSNTVYPDDLKDTYRTKVKFRFGLTLLSRSEELQSPKIAVQQLNFASRFLASSCQDNEDVQNRNVEYGFYRNLLGGSVIAIAVCLFGFIWGIMSSDSILSFWFLILGGIYTLVFSLVFCSTLKRAAEDYAFKAIYCFLSKTD